MRILFLGTAGYHPSETRHTSCVFIPELGLALDAGSSFFRIPQYLMTDTLDVYLSHAHLDHVLGLTFLLDIQYLHPLQEVCVHGEVDKLRAVREHLFAPEIFPVAPPFTSVPLLVDAGGAASIGRHRGYGGETTVRWFPLAHPGGSLGYRIDTGKGSLAYVTDTTADPNAPYVEEIRGVDMLIHECNFPDGWEELAQKTGHSSLTEVAHVARKAGVGHLVLTHFNPLDSRGDPVDSSCVRDIFAPITVAHDGLELIIGRSPR